MRSNRVLLSVIVTIIAAISISSCTYRSSYNPGYDYGYGYGRRYYRVPPPPPRVVVVQPNRPRVIHADRYRSSRYNDRAYRRQSSNGNHYGQRNRTRGPR
ncbi:hypothetical protein [Dyadobacter sp. CY326]|uniref:hypothetical protein n=1 Tax=Dyadobacter sp. CY326 TaxID=2907300 RepID=UPI001F331C86|nr:hypothetical protein [Dyadobacter sp. CY326]MCE7068124.1 hypothetical protein [Dyadobacter sp. CY326]